MFGWDENLLSSNSSRWHFEEIISILDEAEKRFQDVVCPINDRTYERILNESFAKSVLYMREIITLLYNGFPDGAMTLGKNLYEEMITLTFLEKYKEDFGLIDRYFDDFDIKLISESIHLLNFLYSGAEEENIKQGIQDMLLQKKRNYKALKNKNEKYTHNGAFRPYWWIGDILNEKSASFSAIHKESEWYNTIFKHIYDIVGHQGHSGTAISETNSPASVLTTPTTEGFQIPVCFTLTAFSAICQIVFSNYEIEVLDISKQIQEIVKPLFSEVWKAEE